MKNKFFYAILLSSVLLILQGWSFLKVFNKHEGPENGFVWYQIKENGLYGAVDQYDNELLPCQFQSVKLSEDSKNGNDLLDYLWRLTWNVIDEHGDKLEIILYTFNDGWRYYYTKNERTGKTRVSNRNYNNVVIPYSTKQSVSTLYTLKNSYIVEHAPSIAKLHYFYVTISQYGCGIYTENGEAIIPVERQEGPIIACEQDGRAWYMYGNAICDAQGSEIFRFDDNFVKWKTLAHSKWFQREYQELVDEYKWYGGFGDCIIYNADKGFGSLQKKDLDDYYKGLYIRYTGIKLSSNSSSFDVKPSGNNNRARVINLRTYTQSSGSIYPSNNYYAGEQYTSYPQYESSSYSGGSSSGSEIKRTPTKQWRTVTRQEDCHFCHGLGKCWTCNGKGWCHNEYGVDGIHDCPNCTNGNCPHCNGTGKVTKIEQVYE